MPPDAPAICLIAIVAGEQAFLEQRAHDQRHIGDDQNREVPRRRVGHANARWLTR